MIVSIFSIAMRQVVPEYDHWFGKILHSAWRGAAYMVRHVNISVDGLHAASQISNGWEPNSIPAFKCHAVISKVIAFLNTARISTALPIAYLDPKPLQREFPGRALNCQNAFLCSTSQDDAGPSFLIRHRGAFTRRPHLEI
nr:hypothetical protein CFP56_25920 [Quercus suber]